MFFGFAAALVFTIIVTVIVILSLIYYCLFSHQDLTGG